MSAKLKAFAPQIVSKLLLEVTLLGALSLISMTARSEVSCSNIHQTQLSALILSDHDYEFYAKKFAEGRIRNRGILNFEKWSADSSHSLRPAEEAAIYFYTYNPNFVGMKGPLRVGRPENQIEPSINAAIKLAISGLRKLPDYQGLVYRGGVRNEKFYDEVREKYTEGAVIIEETFLSTSKGSSWRCDFRHAPLVDFFINSKTGKDIENFSVNRREREVLFLPGTRFRVDKVESNRRLQIWMTEI